MDNARLVLEAASSPIVWKDSDVDQLPRATASPPFGRTLESGLSSMLQESTEEEQQRPGHFRQAVILSY